jgi:hypothetical protein
MGETSQLTFRISLWRPWLLALTPLALLAALGVAVSVVAGQLAAAVTILLGFAALAVALLLPIGLAVWVSRCVRNACDFSALRHEEEYRCIPRLASEECSPVSCPELGCWSRGLM